VNQSWLELLVYQPAGFTAYH